MDPFNTRAERNAIRTFIVGVAFVLALLMSLRLRAAPTEQAVEPVVTAPIAQF